MTNDPDLGRIADGPGTDRGRVDPHRHEPRRPRQLMNGIEVMYAACGVAVGVALAHLVWIGATDIIRRRRRRSS